MLKEKGQRQLEQQQLQQKRRLLSRRRMQTVVELSLGLGVNADDVSVDET